MSSRTQGDLFMPIVLPKKNLDSSPTTSFNRRAFAYQALMASTLISGLSLFSSQALAQQETPRTNEPHSGARSYAARIKIVPNIKSGVDRSKFDVFPTCTLRGTVRTWVSPWDNNPAIEGQDYVFTQNEYSVQIQARRLENGDITFGDIYTEVLFDILADDEVEAPEIVRIDSGGNSYDITCDAGVESPYALGSAYGDFFIQDPSTPKFSATTIPARQKSLSSQLNSLRTLSLHNSITRDRSIAKEIDRARKNNSGFRANNLQVRLQDQSLPVGTLLGGGAGDSAEFGRWGAFVTGNVDFGKQEKNSALESDFQTNMLIAGVDYKVSNNVVLGAALTHSDTNAGDDKTANTDFRRYSLSLFGSLYSRDKFYLDGMITYGTSAYDLDRRIVRDAGGYDTSSAKTDGDELSASLGAGYNLQHNNINARLFTFINYVDTNIDGYSENVSGNSSAAVVDGMDLQSLIANIGVELSWNINTGVGVFTPMLSIAHEHQYADDSVYVTGRFVGGLDEGKFAYTAPNRDDNYLTAQIGVNAVLPNGVSGFISYDTFVDRKDFGSGQLSVGVRWEF
jgi:outer membrane lipase/esterase